MIKLVRNKLLYPHVVSDPPPGHWVREDITYKKQIMILRENIDALTEFDFKIIKLKLINQVELTGQRTFLMIKRH